MEAKESPSQHQRAALIILNYNGAQYLPDLFSSLAQMDFPKDACDIFFVDNASSDNSLEWAREHARILGRKVTFLQSKENLGFAGGNNLAMRKALEEGYAHIVLLNQDTRVDTKWLSELVAVAESDGTIGAVQSLLLLADEPERINSAGNNLHYLGFGWVGQHKEKIPNSKFQIPNSNIGYASGAAVLYKVEALKKTGFFDERFFMYHEDLELSWRIRLAGYRLVVAPRSTVYHKYRFSGHTKKHWWLWVERNRWFVVLALYRLRTLAVLLPAFLLVEIGVLLYSITRGWLMYKLQSYWQVAIALPDIAKKRRAVARLRVVSDKHIFRFMVGNFQFEEFNHSVIKYIANPALVVYFELAKFLVWW